jgi:D-alanyl-D-alanine carboxypeptidase
MRSSYRFRIASVTKTFVATVVLELVGEGRLGLDDPVERWLPRLVPGGDAITIRELLNHTSGLFDYTHDDAFDRTLGADPGRTWSPRELVAIAASHPRSFPPGTRWEYSNTNYVLLGLVVEAVAATSLEQQLRERLFGPLALRATSFPADAETGGSFVHGYVGPATLPVPRGTLVDITSRLGPSWLWAAGGMVSNGDDVTRFFAALLGGRLLRPDLLLAMRTLAPLSNYGLGLWRFGTPCGFAYGHVGDFLGWRTAVYARPNGRRVAAVMVNIDTTRVSWARLEGAAAAALCSG